ncbi:MAG: hypothetical protein P4L28_05470 [Paludibacteraceae bacterium]|nr:hypothetical protein [Paludibacteraceae bacterium]
MSDIIGHNEPITKITCNSCKHFDKKKMDFICDAFPIRIPKEILSGHNMHTEPLPNQKNDIVFEPVENPKWMTPEYIKKHTDEIK